MIFKASPDTSSQATALTSIKQLSEVDEKSAEGLVFILKHSTRCGISHAALEHYESFAAGDHGVQIYYLDLLAHRDISDALTIRYGVPHSSPQVLVIREGKSIRHATHYAIDQKWLRKASLGS